MNEALRRFKEDRPEEYQEYRGYQRKFQLLNVRFIGACAVALSVVVGCFYLWNVVIALLVALIAFGALLWLSRSQSHLRSTLRLSMALMQLTFDDPSEISSEVKEDLKKIINED